MASMESFDFTSEELFVEAAAVLDGIFNDPNSAPDYLNSLWDDLKIRLKQNARSNAPQADLDKVCGVLFYVVAATLSLHWREYYNKILVNQLRTIVERKGVFPDAEEQEQIINNLCAHAGDLDEWINQYDEAEEWLSDEIEDSVVKFGKLQGVLDTRVAREAFAICIEKGWMEETQNGYKWIGVCKRGQIAQLAYLCGKIYDFKHNETKHKGGEFPEEALDKLFNVKNLEKQLVQAYSSLKPQKWRALIDEIFE
ncbi:MAG: hypothetical protein IJ762_08110 [Bacteroidaceae bacterium]|nr:hypothetical protein [Bacteroidaceae bacterium]